MELSNEQAWYSQKVLEHAQIGMQYVASTAVFETQPEHLWNQVVLRMRAFVLRDHVASDTYEESVRVPATWWQMWKLDHAPAWLRRHLNPVEYESLSVKVKVDRYLAYPDAAIRTPDMGKAYIYEQVTPWN